MDPEDEKCIDICPTPDGYIEVDREYADGTCWHTTYTPNEIREEAQAMLDAADTAEAYLMGDFDVTEEL